MRSRKHILKSIQRRSFLWALIVCFFVLLIKFSSAKPGPSGSKELIPNPWARYPHMKRLIKAATAFTNAKKQVRELRSTNLILITTLNGDLHGVDRYGGQVLWSLEGIAGGPLIKTSARSAADIQIGAVAADDDSVGDNEKSQNIDKDENQTNPRNDESYENHVKNSELSKFKKEDEDLALETFIVEPTDDGILYRFSPKTGLQKLPFSIKQLVDLSPFRSEDGKLFIGSKTTKSFAVDPRTGKILQSFDSEGDNECPYMGTMPRDALYMGKNTYKISIFDGKSNKPMWNVTYSEFVPNSLDTDLVMDYESSPDGLYIASTQAGEILSTDSSTGQHVWYQMFQSPAIGVFDVLATSELSNGLYIIKQPKPPHKYYEQIYKLQPTLSTSAYIGHIDGTLFAMSAKNYPMTQFMRLSKWAEETLPATRYDHYPLTQTEDDNDDDSREFCHPGSETYPACLIGNHILGAPARPLIGSQPNSQTKSRSIQMQRQSNLIYSGFSWMLIVVIVGGILYWNGRKKYSDHPWTLRIINFLKLKADFKEMNVKSGKKKKKGSKGPAVNSAKKVEPKDDEGEKATSLNYNSQNFSVATSTNTAVTNSEQVLNLTPPTAQVNGDVPNHNEEVKRFGSLVLSETVLGYGSHGTIVYKGTFEGRDVAVKRLLLDFYDIAHHEVSLLQESDDHPNVIRYYCKEQCDRFLYIALELCPASLHDVIERKQAFRDTELLGTLNPPRILYQIISGLHHLHSMKIVHRDIKPQNILIAAPKHKRQKKDGITQPCVARVLISDFGLCKKLEGETSSFHNTTNNASGTIGWRAPELLSLLSPPSSEETNSLSPENAWTTVDRVSDASFTSSSSDNGNTDGQPRRVTKAIDIFSAGCLFYYILSDGDHPFGDRYSREVNILKGVYDLNKLDDMGKEDIEARDLIERMIERDPKKRPKAATVMIHPYFWPSEKRLAFLQDASDRFEVEERDPPSPLLRQLEQNATSIIGPDWYKRIDKVLVENLGRYRKYDGSRVRDLLRALRNKKHHFQDLPENVKRSLGEIPGGFLLYFTSRFPKLMLHVYYVISGTESLKNESMFRRYFEIPES